MLVLTRKLMEKLFIGDDICVTVVRLEGGRCGSGSRRPARSGGPRRARPRAAAAAAAARPSRPRPGAAIAPRRQALTIRGSWNR